MNSEIINKEALELLKKLIAITSFSKEEEKTGEIIVDFFN